jgi:hypothetical protein
MLKDVSRVCDVCGETIPRGTTYAVHVLPQASAKLLISLNNDNPEAESTFTLDSQGNARLDICLECKANMGIQGKTVN